MYQMKEQGKSPEKQLNEVEIGNLPKREFRTMIVKMIQDLGKRMEAKIEKMLASMSFRFDREIKSFSDKQKLRKFSTTKPALQQMLKELP